MKLLIVDDDALIVKSLSLSLGCEPDITIIGCASDGGEALNICAASCATESLSNGLPESAAQNPPRGLPESAAQNPPRGLPESAAQNPPRGLPDMRGLPDIILMDIRMPGVDGIAATRLIKQRHPQVRIMMLTTFDDRPNIRQALAAGADGYLVKTDRITDIAGKLRVMMDGTGVLDAEVLKKLTLAENPQLERLTPRERDITRLVAQGMTNKDIAAHLFLSEGTVRNKIVVIMEKLDVSNRTQLGMAYYNHGEC